MCLNFRQFSIFCVYYIFPAQISTNVNVVSNNSNFISQFYGSNWTLHTKVKGGRGGGLSPKFKNPLKTIDFTDPGGLISAWFKNCVDF